MLVHYFSHAGSETGPGRAARDWIKALRLAGCEVVERSLADATVKCEADGLLLYHGSPAQLTAIAETFPADGRACIAVTTWETTRLPEKFAVGLNCYDAIITPSEFCRDVLSQACGGVLPSINVVPHCFDPSEWIPSDHPGGEVFTFYTIGSWGERKNVLGVLRAYLHEFSRADKTRLVIISQDADFKILHSIIARSGIPPAELPGLSIPDRELSAQEIIQLHWDADCFVSTTRGEGWGLGMFEAMIMQRPVVAPCEGGQLDFLDDFDGDQWWPVLAHLTPVFAGEGEVAIENGAVSGKLRLPNGADARQLWFDPSLGGTAKQMRAVYDRFKDSRDYSCYRGNRQELEDRFSAPVVGSLVKDALQEISGS